MNRNIELKARCPDLGEAHRVVREIGATLHAVEGQRDTYFYTTHGRLKLRERWRRDSMDAPLAGVDANEEVLTSQLIWYHRPDEAKARPSNYSLFELSNGKELHQLLSLALGVATEVIKLRTVFLHDNVRIHLDDVAWVGTFLEFEAIVDETCDDATALAKLDRLVRAFAIAPEDVLSHCYADLR